MAYIPIMEMETLSSVAFYQSHTLNYSKKMAHLDKIYHIRTLKIRYFVKSSIDSDVDTWFPTFIGCMESEYKIISTLVQINLEILPSFGHGFDQSSFASSVSRDLGPLSDLGKPISKVIGEADDQSNINNELRKVESHPEAGWTAPGAVEELDDCDQLIWPDVKKGRGWGIQCLNENVETKGT